MPIDETSESGQKKLLDAMWKSVNHEAVIAALEVHPENANYPVPTDKSKWQTLAVFLTSPDFQRKHKPMSLSTAATKCGIAWRELIEYFAHHQRSEGMYRLMSKLPDAMEQVAEDALKKTVTCPTCEGEKMVATGKTDDDGIPLFKRCVPCEGTGQVTIAADKDARKMTFEMAGLLNKAGPMVAIQQNFGGTSLEDNVMSVGKILSGG